MSDIARLMGAHVEFIEPYTRPVVSDQQHKQASVDDLPCIKPYRIRINGVDVGLIKKGSVIIDPGSGSHAAGDPLSVTLTLFPRSITIRAE